MQHKIRSCHVHVLMSMLMHAHAGSCAARYRPQYMDEMMAASARRNRPIPARMRRVHAAVQDLFLTVRSS